MRTTIELPDPLFRQVKARAALEGRSLKDLLTEYVERGLGRSEQANLATRPERSEPPSFIPAASTGETIPALSNQEIAAILDEEDAERVLRSTGP